METQSTHGWLIIKPASTVGGGVQVKDFVSSLKLVLLYLEVSHLDIEFWVLVVVEATTTHTHTGFIAPY